MAAALDRTASVAANMHFGAIAAVGRLLVEFGRPPADACCFVAAHAGMP